MNTKWQCIADDQAFATPNSQDGRGDTTVHQYGLTKREYFAAAVIQGLAANSIPGMQHIPQNIVREALDIADLLIEALNK